MPDLTADSPEDNGKKGEATRDPGILKWPSKIPVACSETFGKAFSDPGISHSVGRSWAGNRIL